MAGQTAARQARDPRLDFFRGLGMIIILIAHMPGNSWANWIPARFGFSDAADMFVFCSGMASALAFGGVFATRGFLLGLGRTILRVWQVYWAHIGSFLVTVAMLLAIDRARGSQHAIADIGLAPFFAEPQRRLLELMTLTYVPDYFDILPMYLTLLTMIPAAMALARIDPRLVFVAMILVWIGARLGVLRFIADMQTGRPWFFNPFGWQLVFFSGFALMRGWQPAPPRDARLVALAALIVVLAAPIGCGQPYACYAGWGHAPALGAAHDALGPLIDKTDYGALRYVHFMATVYLAWIAVGEGGRRLHGPVVNVIRRVGQQTLAVFLTGIVASHGLGVVLDATGRGALATALVNIVGVCVLIAAAYVTHWFKAAPWRAPSVAKTLSNEEKTSLRVTGDA